MQKRKLSPEAISMWNAKPAYPPQDTPANEKPAEKRLTEPLVDAAKPPAAPPPTSATSMAARITAMPQTSVAVIGKTLSVKGEISGSGPLHIEGRVEGTIRLDGAYLNIGPEAMVKAQISAREVVVRGSVNGNVNVSERIDIRNGGSVTGDVTSHSVSIEEGAFFKGSIDMRRTETALAATQPVHAKVTAPKPAEPQPAEAVTA
jgi:cytoskeletal protein CcmA (bactofilin family)